MKPRVFLLLAAASLWLFWPLLRPVLAPTHGTTLVVVVDGYHRLDTALARTGSLPLLLITCPLTGQPTPAQRRRARGRPFGVLRQGWDSVHQMLALVHWLQQPPRGLPAVGRVLLVSDSHHLPRLLPVARLALGSHGTTVHSLTASHALPPPGPWPILRDSLRLQLWRATGSTGAFLIPGRVQAKRSACELQHNRSESEPLPRRR